MSEQNVNQSNVNEERDVKFLDKHGLHTVWGKTKKYIDDQDAKLNEKKIDKVHGAEDEVPVFDEHGNLKSSSKTIVEHKYDPVTGEVIAEYEGNIVTGHAVEEALDDLDEGIQEEIDALDAAKADKVQGQAGEDLTGKVVLSDAEGNLESSGRLVVDDVFTAEDPETHEPAVDYPAFKESIPTGQAVVDVIEDMVNRKDAELTTDNGRNFEVHIKEENGVITELDVVDNHSATRLASAAQEDIPVFDGDGDLGTSGRHIVDSLYNEEENETTGEIEETDTEFLGNVPTGKAVQEAINDTVGGLDVADLVQDSSGSMAGKTLKTLSESNGKIAATFQDIAIVSSQVTDKQTNTFDGSVETLTTGKSVKSAIDSAIDSLDKPDTAQDKQFVTAVSEENGIISVSRRRPVVDDITGLSEKILEVTTVKADKVQGATAGNFAGLDANGNLTDSGHKHSDYKTKQTAVQDPTVPSSGTTESVSFIDTISQDDNGIITPTKKNVRAASIEASGIVQLSSSTSSTSEEMAATPLAVKTAKEEAIAQSQSDLSNLDCDNKLSPSGAFNGKYISSLSQQNGLVSYDVLPMANDSSVDSNIPVTAHALYSENVSRRQWQMGIEDLIPGQASVSNQLADKAYVDAIGERLEARYLSSYDAVKGEWIPFPTHAAFVAAQAAYERGEDAFYYNGTALNINTNKIDNNDIVVITADETHKNEAGGASTTRWRYQCDIPSRDNGQWYFEYVINNTALNKAQLDAINSGITWEKRVNYDEHLASQGQDPNHTNPHHVTFDQLLGRNGVDSTELGVLDGVDTDHIGAAQINTLRDIGEEDPAQGTIQYQLNDKMERIDPASSEPRYTVSNKIAVVNDHDLVNGRFGIKDSGAEITHYYSPADETNPATGSAIHQAIEAIEGTHSSTGDKLSITVATDQHGIIDAVTIDDSGLATAEQGAKADSAVQTVTLNGTTRSGNDIDLGNLKTEQSAVSDPVSSGNTQDYQFISTVSQDTNGVITATKRAIPDADTNSTKGVVTLAGSIGGVVSTENRKAATEKAVRDAINDLNKNDISGFGAGKTLATLEENNGIISATFQDIEITKSQVSDFAHSHGNIENNGTIGSDANKVLVTTTDGQIVAGDIDGTYSVDNKIATVSTVSGAIEDLDYTDIAVTSQFVTSVSETDGVIEVTRAQPGIIDVDGLSDRLDGIDTSISSLDTRKADKVVPAAGVDLEGHLATLDSTGNLEDSGYRVVNTYKVSDDKSAYLANPVTGTAVDAAIAESASGDRQYVDEKIAALDATESSSDQNNVQVTVTQVDGVITDVSVVDNSANQDDIDDTVEAAIEDLDATVSSSGQNNVQVTVTEEDGVVTGVSVADHSANQDDIDASIADLDAEVTSVDGTNVQVKVTEVDGVVTAVNVATDNTVNASDVSGAIGEALGELDAEETGNGTNVSITVNQVDGLVTGVSVTDDSVNATDVANAISAAIGNLDKNDISGFGRDKTLASLSESDGIISATFQDILVDTANIDDGAVTTVKLDDGAVTEGKIYDGAVTEDKIGTGAVTTGKIDDGAVTGDKIAASAVTEGKIGTGAVTEDKIYDGSVTTAKIADDAVTNGKIADNAVDTAQLIDDAVTTAKLADDAVTNTKIADDAVNTDQIVDGAVTEGKIGTGAVTTAKINDSAVTTGKIADDAVTTDKIVDDAVTNDKIADDAVDTDQIADDAVTNGKIADNAVNTAQIADDAVTTGKIADDAVTANKVKDGEVLPVDISGNAATATVADDVIDGGTLDQRIEGIESNVTSLQTGKADKVAGATSGNFAALDANGNLTDSGHKHSDYKAKQTAQTNTGSVLKTVAKLDQDANGELDVEFSDIQSASTSQKGVVQLAGSIGATVESENNKAASEKAVRDAIDSAIGGTIDSLDVEEVGGAGKYISAISETDGKISATATTMDTTPTSASTNAVTSGGVYTAINSAVNALDATVSGSSTNVSVSVTETDGKLASITVTDTAATSDHVHGNITNDGKVGTATNKVLVTTTGGEVVAGNIDGTYNASTNKIATQATVTSAINALDVSNISGFGADKTLATLAETDGKIAASFQSIQIAESQVTGLETDLEGIDDALDTKEDKANKVTSWSATTTDTSYPSEKLVKDSLDTKVDKTTKVNGHALSGDVTVTKSDVGLGNVVNTGDSDTPVENGTTKFTTGGAYTELNKKADKTATVSNVAYDGTNKKITKTINGTSSDVVTAATLKADMALDNVANTNITVSATDGVTDNTNNVTYKYEHPTFTATTAAAKKVGMNAEGHVVLGDSLTKADVGLDLVSNQTITVTDTSVSDGTHTFNKYVHPTTTATAAAAVKVGNDSEGHVVLGDALQKGDVGLGNVDNTSDANKPVSTAQQTALNAKLDKTAGVTAVTWDSTNKKITKTINGTTSDVVTAATLKTAMALDNVTNDAQVKRSEMGVANGVATLDNDGKVPASQLPSYIDDVIEGYYDNGAFYEDSAHTVEIPPESGKVYVDKTTNLTYRWSGTAYVKIASDLALGETESTAYRGDRGKTAYDHSQLTSGNPHNVSKTDVGLGNVVNTGDSATPVSGGTTKFTTGGAYTELNKKADKVTNATEDNFASFDANGNLQDSGHTHSDYKTKQTAKSDPTASGTTITAIDTISQNANGEITATKKTIRSASTSQTGVVQLQGSIGATETENSKAATPKAVRDALDGLVGGLDAEVTSTDGTNVQVTVTETNGKITAVNVTTDNTASNTHTHGNITNAGAIGSASEHAVYTTTNGVLTAGSLVTTDPTASGNTLDFIATVSQDSKGKITATKKTVSTMGAATSSAAGTAGLVPAPGSGKQGAFLRGDGTWQTPTDNKVTQTLLANTTDAEYPVILKNSTTATDSPTATENYAAGITVNPKNKSVTATKFVGSLEGTANTAKAYDTSFTGTNSIKSALDGKASSTHTHGNITNAGALQTNDVTIASGDKLVITDSSNSNKVARASAAFDGSTATKALTKKGTFEDFVNQSDIDTAIENIPTISLVGDNHITVTSDDTTGTVTVATDIAAQTAYTAKGSATKVPQITTNALGQVTGITEVTISGVTPASHPHGNITNDGKIGSTADLAVVTGTSGAVTTADLSTAAPSASGTTTSFIDTVSQSSNGKITATKKTIASASTSAQGIVQLAGSIGTTVSSENNKAASEKAVRDAINALDVSDITANLGVGKTITALSESDGKISATASSIQIAESQVTNLTTDLGNKEDKSNKVSSWSSTTNNTRYPSEKLVKDSLDAKENTSNKVTAWQSTPDNTHYPSEKLVYDTLNSKVPYTSDPSKIESVAYPQCFATTASYHDAYLIFYDVTSAFDGTFDNITSDQAFAAFSGFIQSCKYNGYGEPQFYKVECKVNGKYPQNKNASTSKEYGPVVLKRTYTESGETKTQYVLAVKIPANYNHGLMAFGVFKWYVSNTPNCSWSTGFLGTFIATSSTEYTVHWTWNAGYNVAASLFSARELAVNLANTSTTSTFDGSANQTGIKVSGTLGIANGGTGATTANAARNSLLGNMNLVTTDPDDGTPIVMRYLSPTDSNGAVYVNTASRLWNYMKGKMTSATGVNISGNAATATTATNVDLAGSVKTTSTTNGDTIQIQAGSGTAAEVTIVNAKHAASADSATKATKDSDGNAINATYFKSSGNVTLVSGSATKIGTQNGADVKLTLPTIPAAVSVKGNAESTYRTGQVNLTPANLGISATSTSVTVGSTTFSQYSHPAGSAPSVTGFPTDGATLSFGGTFDVNQVTTDSTSHVSAITKRTFTLPSLGTTASTAAKGNHTHATSIASDSTSGATVVSLSANAQYKITAGGTSVIFKTPVDTTYSSKTAASGGTEVSLVTTGEKWTWNHKQDALTEMTTAEVSALVAAFAS